jgi:hypothetical protein
MTDEQRAAFRDEVIAFLRRTCDGVALGRLADALFDSSPEKLRGLPDSAFLVGASMLEYQRAFGGGVLGHWTTFDLAQFLMAEVPANLIVRNEELDGVPDCVLAFLSYLHERGMLSGAPLHEHEEMVERARAPLRGLATCRENWTTPKAVLLQMLEEGTDPSDGDAFERWMADFNARPQAERDAVIGGTIPVSLPRFDLEPAHRRRGRHRPSGARRRGRRRG